MTGKTGSVFIGSLWLCRKLLQENQRVAISPFFFLPSICLSVGRNAIRIAIINLLLSHNNENVRDGVFKAFFILLIHGMKACLPTS